jgi:hypothetical protein
VLKQGHNSYQSQAGLSLLVVLAFLTVIIVIASTFQEEVISVIRRSRHQSSQAVDDIELVSRINEGVSWLRANSNTLADIFARTEFYTHFRLASSQNAANQGPHLDVPTRLRLSSGMRTPLLTNSSLFGAIEFPVAIDGTNHSDLFLSAFRNAPPLAITFVDAYPLDPSRDFGPNEPAQTDFIPVVRIDVLSSTTGGGHRVAYLRVSRDGNTLPVSFYGEQRVDLIGRCNGYSSTASGNPRRAPAVASCHIASAGRVTITSSGRVYGAVSAKEGMAISGRVCGDMACRTAGDICNGSSCAVPSLPTYPAWDTLCPQSQSQLQISNSAIVQLEILGNDPINRCWDEIKFTGDRMRRIRLVSTNHPYFIRTLNLEGNSGRRIEVSPSPGSSRVELYIERIVDLAPNTMLFRNRTNKPTQFFLHYLGTAPLVLDQNYLYARVVAPYALVQKSSITRFFGSIFAQEVILEGTAGRLARYDTELNTVNGPLGGDDLLFDIAELSVIHQDLW